MTDAALLFGDDGTVSALVIKGGTSGPGPAVHAPPTPLPCRLLWQLGNEGLFSLQWLLTVQYVHCN